MLVVSDTFPLSNLDLIGHLKALWLALSISADHVLMVEQDGRLRAAALGVRTIGDQ